MKTRVATAVKNVSVPVKRGKSSSSSDSSDEDSSSDEDAVSAGLLNDLCSKFDWGTLVIVIYKHDLLHIQEKSKPASKKGPTTLSKKGSSDSSESDSSSDEEDVSVGMPAMLQ